MAQKKDSKKSSKADAKKLELKKAEKALAKKAEKALAKAEDAVQVAREAVRDSSKTLRKRASALTARTEKLAAAHAKADRLWKDAVEQATNESAPDLGAVTEPRLTALRPLSPSEPPSVTPVTPSVKPEPASAKAASSESAWAKPASAKPTSGKPSEAAPLTPPLPKGEAPAPTLIELREQARDRKIAGYSRMNKAALIEALEKAPTP